MKTRLDLIAWVIICLAAGFIGSIFTMPAIPTWYAGINKPPFNPPNWIFGPVWTTLFILMGISAWLIWEKRFSNKEVRSAIMIFSAQLVLNMLWSIIFFGFKSPLLAFADIIVLWLLILAAILSFYRISRPAAWLLIPYILWVSFASVLNLSIWLLNRF